MHQDTDKKTDPPVAHEGKEPSPPDTAERNYDKGDTAEAPYKPAAPPPPPGNEGETIDRGP